MPRQQPSNWHNKKVKPPKNKECQTPNCGGEVVKNYRFSDGGHAQLCRECWIKWDEKLDASN